jgi:hypothetical protein
MAFAGVTTFGHVDDLYSKALVPAFPTRCPGTFAAFFTKILIFNLVFY